MSANRVIGICMVAITTGTWINQLLAQEHAYSVVDFVELPQEFAVHLSDGTRENCYDMKFHEQWNILPEKSILQKRVISYSLMEPGTAETIADPVPPEFTAMMARLPMVNGSWQLRNVSYEFMLLDPHLTDSTFRYNPENGSLDSLAGAFQRDLFELVRPALRYGNWHHDGERMLSLFFHEKWFIDPSTLKISKEVQAITPVIWQRRQTENGEPINEAGTGLPVYYKNRLDRIDLRNQ